MLPRLNHLFIAGAGRSTPAEYQQPGHVDLEAIEAIARFIDRVLGALPGEKSAGASTLTHQSGVPP